MQVSTELIKKNIYWDAVEGAGLEEYDESFLATLRSELKELENTGNNVLIVPVRYSGNNPFWGCDDAEVMSEQSENELFEAFTSAMVHVARRVKDCKNVVGFACPDFKKDWDILQHHSEDYIEKFKAAFQKKHSHYIFVQ